MSQLYDNLMIVATALTDNDTQAADTLLHLRGRIDNKVEKAIYQAESIQRRMQSLIRDLKEEGAEASFNTLGEIQGSGNELDRILGEIATMREFVRTLAKEVR